MDFVGNCTLIGQNVEYDCYFSQEVRHRKLQAMIAANRMSLFFILMYCFKLYVSLHRNTYDSFIYLLLTCFLKSQRLIERFCIG